MLQKHDNCDWGIDKEKFVHLFLQVTAWLAWLSRFLFSVLPAEFEARERKAAAFARLHCLKHSATLRWTPNQSAIHLHEPTV